MDICTLREESRPQCVLTTKDSVGGNDDGEQVQTIIAPTDHLGIDVHQMSRRRTEGRAVADACTNEKAAILEKRA